MDTLHILASPGCAYSQTNLNEAINKIMKPLTAEFYDRVIVQADFQKAYGFSFIHPNPVLRFYLRIQNLNSFESIPPNTKIEVSETSRFFRLSIIINSDRQRSNKPLFWK